ncbi:sensor histidine kinase [Spirosoma sp. KUDC1026]|uniref:sensor histidine kinase n=1 Tax=Spirosoma sp. KUDC1026 TaxID=2745947 RepID=UPI00159BACB2|nr:ATP-binding protein [Spirosoma sp. KUDC1026]QKZ12931.1 PAS domain-containing protein [Spirosoma sp. KUDC1026]
MNPLRRFPHTADQPVGQAGQPPASSGLIELALAAYETALNSVISMVAIRDEGGTVVDFLMQTANPTVEKSLFMKPEQIIGSRLLETFPGNIESGLFDMYVRIVETGQPESATQYYNDANGLEAWFAVSAVRQEPDAVVTSFTNITDVKRAEQLAQQQADLLNTVLNHSQTAISLHAAIRNRNGIIVDFRTVVANQQSLELWGDLADDVLHKSFMEVVSSDQREREFPRYVRVIETGEPDLDEFCSGDKWFMRLLTKSGDGIVISSVDVSESRRYRQQLEATNLELKQSNENLRSFAYIASHDLQEPLRKIQAFGDILRERYAPELGADGSDLVHRMQSAAERMSLLIRNLLDYSRITSQRDMFRSFSLTRLLEDIVEDLWHPIQQTGARIEMAHLPELAGDRLQLRQLFQNLLSNALKFCRTDVLGNLIPPHIRISAERIEGELPDDLKKDLLMKQPYWAITVADNGIGFDQRYADRIFQVFQRLHGKQQFAGTGIGLAVVKKVVEQHSGAIRVKSAVGQGAEFTVYLPA